MILCAMSMDIDYTQIDVFFWWKHNFMCTQMKCFQHLFSPISQKDSHKEKRSFFKEKITSSFCWRILTYIFIVKQNLNRMSGENLHSCAWLFLALNFLLLVSSLSQHNNHQVNKSKRTDSRWPQQKYQRNIHK